MTKSIQSGPYRTFRALNDYESFLEYEGSTITIPMRGRMADGTWLRDVIKLHAFMRLEIYPPYINNLGTREFQFTIRDWDLYGSSPMLNQLFYGDPRGRLTESVHNGARVVDYVPVNVLFRVHHNFDIGVDDEGISAADLFGSPQDLDIRNLTSHAFRNWVKRDELDGQWGYTQPGNLIYWEVLSGAATKALAQRAQGRQAAIEAFLKPGTPVIVFHKKDPRAGGFDIGDDEDRSAYLLGFARLDGGKRLLASTQEALRGFEGNFTQLHANTVLSSLNRPRAPLEFRWRVSDKFKDMLEFDQFVTARSRDKDVPRLSGHIRMVSPARSLTTAEQRPDAGDPYDSADFPARISYAINYDIFLNKERFVADQAGIAIAVGALEIPPRDVKVAFEKPYLGDVLGRFLEFSAGDCTGMDELNQVVYEHGVNFARYCRQVPLAPDDPEWAAFTPFDPAQGY